MIDLTIQGFDALEKKLKAEAAAEQKALETAIRVEGYRLMRTLKAEIRRGAPGGKPFAPKSVISRRVGRGRKPLSRLALGVRYQVTRKPFEVRVGWTGPKVSKSWKRLAERHQRGFETEVTPKMRRRFRKAGEALPRRSQHRKYFFLRKTTRKFRTPARPIIKPFWAAHRNEAWRNIKKNYRRKMAGERI